MYSAVPVDRWMANALFREVPDDEEDEDEKKDHEEEEKDEEEEKGIRNEGRPSPKTIYPVGSSRFLCRQTELDYSPRWCEERDFILFSEKAVDAMLDREFWKG